MTSSLISVVRNKFLDAIRSVNPPARWKILVVDEHAQKLLSSVLKQFDILEENVTLIESITTNREPQPGFEAVYLLMPTTENIGRIIRDFEGRQQYAAAHIFFIEGLPEQLFERLFASSAEPYLKAVQDLFLNFWAIEHQAFSLKSPGAFFSMYSPPRTENEYVTSRLRLEEDLRFLAKGIANLCITLNEYPYIRYYLPSHHEPLGPFKPHVTTRAAPPPTDANARWRTNLARGDQARAYESTETDFVSKVLAFMIQETLDDHKKGNSEYPKKTDRGRATLIITDRAMDLCAPLVHEFTYQAMCNDLLPIEGGTKYTYKFQSSTGVHEDKAATLSDADNVWTEVRHMHMREAIDKLMLDFNNFMVENAGFKGGEGAASLNDMKDMLANLPQYQEMREKFSLHLNMAEQCMSIFEKDKLPTVANVEQCCATGLTVEKKTPKHLVEDMVPLLDSRDIINANKVRVIALYILHRDGVPDEDRRRLYQHARLSLAEQDAVNALLLMGARISRGPGDRDTKRKLKQRSLTDDEYELSRFKPLLRNVIEDNVSGRLDATLFPYVKDAPLSAASASPLAPPPPQATSLRSAKANWHKSPRVNAPPDNRQRLIVFVAGGMTYSEMREAYQLSSSLKKEIIIGSTHAIQPRQFVDDLKVLEIGGVGSKAVPNGMKDPREKRPFQEYYDQKYFLKDPPPPPPPAVAKREDRGRAPPRMSPAPSSSAPSMFTASTASVNSTGTGKEEKEKKKKKGLFRF